MTVTVDISEQIIYNVGRELRSPIDLNNNRYVLDRIEQKHDVIITPVYGQAPDGRGYIFKYEIEFKSEKAAAFFLLKWS
jgi:hypothetical protein